MIIGAGEAGKELLDEMLRSNHLNVQAKCFIDDDTSKHGKYISDVPIVGWSGDLYTDVIDCIGWSIKEEQFNPDYLEQ